MIQIRPDDPALTAGEAADIARIVALAALRGGVLTDRQKDRIDRIAAKVRARRDQAK
ncbi:hypothetical protein ACFZAM_02990 [Streptomyces sp. NPDC008079]|uniref:hypothetical protein n=1 Tax=Streptomyces sp. NPDC008079 TaxID=3364806 RepID=UPI0036F17581